MDVVDGRRWKVPVVTPATETPQWRSEQQTKQINMAQSFPIPHTTPKEKKKTVRKTFGSFLSLVSSQNLQIQGGWKTTLHASRAGSEWIRKHELACEVFLSQ